MAIQLAIISNRIRRVIKIHSRGNDVIADVVVSHRRRTATSGRRPGAGWNRDPQTTQKGRWVNYQPLIQRVSIDKDDFIELEEWPIGYGAAPFGLEDLAKVILPFMQRAVDAGGVKARRTLPPLKLETIVLDIKREGLSVPTEIEFEKACKMAWDTAAPKGRKKGKRTPGIVPKPVAPAEPATTRDSGSLESKKGQEEDGKDDAGGEEGEPEGGDDTGEEAGATSEDAPEADPEAVSDDDTDSSAGDEGDDEIVEDASAVDLGLESPDDVPEGSYWSTAMSAVLEDTEDNHLSDTAVDNGWPFDMMTGASKRSKGEAGYTLAYMAKNDYDSEKHG